MASSTADQVRAQNQAIDDELRELLDAIRPEHLSQAPTDEWSVGENLGHLAEFPGYFARQLRAWIDGDQVVVGRVAEHDPSRNDAIVQAPERQLEELRAAITTGLAELTDTLARLHDVHLTTPTQNVKYGEEPLTAYLSRYVVGHKAAHVRQLREALDHARRSDRGQR